MYKLLTVLSLALSSLLLTQCKSTSSLENQDTMTLSNPSFASIAAHYNTYVAGAPGGGSGIEFYIPTSVPSNVSLEKVYFRESVGKLMQGNVGYVARFRTDNGIHQDVIMSSDTDQEAANTAPAAKDTFPFKLSKDQAGIIYKEEGLTKYCILSNITEKTGVAYPQQQPRGNGY